LETDSVKSQLLSIKPTITSSFTILHEFHMTMLYGKRHEVFVEQYQNIWTIWIW